jgi:hypothetical protein
MKYPDRVIAKYLQDVRRLVREEVSWVGVLSFLDAIDHPTAVGVNQATQQLPWIPADDLLLPLFKSDHPPMLHTRRRSASTPA